MIVIVIFVSLFFLATICRYKITIWKVTHYINWYIAMVLDDSDIHKWIKIMHVCSNHKWNCFIFPGYDFRICVDKKQQKTFNVLKLKINWSLKISVNKTNNILLFFEKSDFFTNNKSRKKSISVSNVFTHYTIGFAHFPKK